jgi:peptidyl-prolyl cis-trans isomerase A (cyclophilin A)
MATELAARGVERMADTLTATLQTNQGRIVLRLFPDHAPKTVRNFVELAEGGREWTDPRTGRPTTTKLYDGTIFHRVIPDFMIQGGDPLGSGRGGPGYKFADEIHPDLRFNRPHLLAMANAGPGTNGSQFFITVAPTPWLDGKHTIFGEVIEGADVVDRISRLKTASQDRPAEDVTYVSCVRCGRYACPDCMRSASVGQQCVECVGQVAPGARQARPGLGGRSAAGAVVTWTLVAINVAIFLLTWLRPSIVTSLEMLGYASYGYGGPLHGVAAGEWYRLITSAFLAPATGLSGLGFVDILFNMWALIFVGPSLEGLLGRLRFLAVYLLSAVGGGVMYYFLAPQNAPAVGASGAIFGLFGAWFVVARRLRLDTRGIAMLIAINLALSFFWHNTIAWQDHIGGLLTGALLTAAYTYAPRKNRVALQVLATAAVVAVLAVAVVIRNGQLTGA